MNMYIYIVYINFARWLQWDNNIKKYIIIHVYTMYLYLIMSNSWKLQMKLVELWFIFIIWYYLCGFLQYIPWYLYVAEENI